LRSDSLCNVAPLSVLDDCPQTIEGKFRRGIADVSLLKG
jgi:hypothetical protein